MKGLKIIFLFFLLFTYNFSGSQTPITYTVALITPATCSTCCDGVMAITNLSGGACAGVYQIEWSNGYTNTFGGGFCPDSVYSVSVYDFPCSDTTTKTFTFTAVTGINEINIKAELKSFPNPASNTLYIKADQSKLENSEIEVINTLGQTILKLLYKNEIDVSSLTSGCYVLKIITSGRQQFHSKFIKE